MNPLLILYPQLAYETFVSRVNWPMTQCLHEKNNLELISVTIIM